VNYFSSTFTVAFHRPQCSPVLPPANNFVDGDKYYHIRRCSLNIYDDFDCWNGVHVKECWSILDFVQDELDRMFSTSIFKKHDCSPSKSVKKLRQQVKILQKWFASNVKTTDGLQVLPDDLFQPDTYSMLEPRTGWNIQRNLWKGCAHKQKQDPLLSIVSKNQAVAGQIVYDLRVLKLMLRLDRAKRCNDCVLILHYLHLITVELEDNPVTATMCIMHDWYAQNCNDFAGCEDWYTIGDHIGYSDPVACHCDFNDVKKRMCFALFVLTVFITILTTLPSLELNFEKQILNLYLQGD
jgi:hypothetical protein